MDHILNLRAGSPPFRPSVLDRDRGLRAALRAPAAWYVACVGGQSTSVIECVPEQKFNVRVCAPQFVRCPPCKRNMNCRIDAEEKVLSLGHGFSDIYSLSLKLLAKVIS